MSLWSRMANLVRGERLLREIDEELESHLQEAIAQGRNPSDARRALGSSLRLREESRDIKLVAWLDSLRADVIFGWRQLWKKKVTTAAAILSLALAIGACTSAFRLIDALLLRPLPVADPSRLYAFSYQGTGFDGQPSTGEGCEYPMFRRLRAAVKDQAELLAISYANRADLTYGSDEEMERAYLQYVSGWMFQSFGLRPAAGRLLSESDDLKPGAHPYAVISYDYWKRRFAANPGVVGRTLRLACSPFGPCAGNVFEIVGVVAKGFTGVEPGSQTDIFIPTMMNPSVDNANATWFRTLIRLRPGAAPDSVRERLQVAFRAFREERAKSLTGQPATTLANFVNHRVLLEPAAAGVSTMQARYRQALTALGVLVALVLLIACANVANLLTAQAAARSREMALRVSIGAGRWRLIQLVLVEGALLAFFAAAVGSLFAWWSAPFVVSRINPPDNPARLSLPADWRVLGFGVALTLLVTMAFGLLPALRASAVKPGAALKGGEDPHSRRRMMHALIAGQAAFCFLVLFAAGLFITTFDRLVRQPIGFAPERLVALDIVPAGAPQLAAWDQVVEHLRSTPGVERVALANWALLSGAVSRSHITIEGSGPSEDTSWQLDISPGWLEAMKIPLLAGRDFRVDDTRPGVAIVNEAFARRYFGMANPVGRVFSNGDGRNRLQVIGLVRDARYADIREPMMPVAYMPFRALDDKGLLRPKRFAALIVRTSAPNPLALAQTLRREVVRTRPEFRVSNIRTQEALVDAQTVRERLVAMLALFFAVVALLLAGVGLYGVLDHSVLERRHEIGIRMAIGAQAGDIARRVTSDVFSMVILGALAGGGAGLASVRYVEALLFQVKATGSGALALPSLAILGVALVAALPATIRAVRIDPVRILRTE